MSAHCPSLGHELELSISNRNEYLLDFWIITRAAFQLWLQPQIASLNNQSHLVQVSSFAKPAPSVKERIPIDLEIESPDFEEYPDYENVQIRPRPSEPISPPQRPPKPEKSRPQAKIVNQSIPKPHETVQKSLQKSKTELTSQWVDECSQNAEIKESVSNYQIEQEKLVSDLRLTLKYELKKSKIEKQRSEIEMQRYKLEYEQMRQRTSGQKWMVKVAGKRTNKL